MLVFANRFAQLISQLLLNVQVAGHWEAGERSALQ